MHTLRNAVSGILEKDQMPDSAKSSFKWLGGVIDMCFACKRLRFRSTCLQLNDCVGGLGMAFICLYLTAAGQSRPY